MFGRAFELRVDYWVRSLPRRFLPSSPCLVVSISEVCVLHVPVTFSPSSLLLAELPPDTRSEDVSKFFDGYGKIIDCRVMTGQSQSLLFALETYPEFH